MDDRTKEITTEFLAGRQQLMSFIYGLVRDPQIAEDIFQETWLKLANSLQQGSVIEHQGKWCRKVAKNLVLQYWRQQRNAKVVADSSLLEFLEFVDLAFEENALEQTSDRQQALNDCVAVWASTVSVVPAVPTTVAAIETPATSFATTVGTRPARIFAPIGISAHSIPAIRRNRSARLSPACGKSSAGRRTIRAM